MMGYHSDAQPKLFYHFFNLDERMPANSVLRKIRGLIDSDFIYREVKGRYGTLICPCNTLLFQAGSMAKALRRGCYEKVL